MKYLIVIPFIFVAVVAMADRTHETVSDESSHGRKLHPVGGPVGNVNWERMNLGLVVRMVDNGAPSYRELAINELTRRLIQNYREISVDLQQFLGVLSPEGRRDITRLLDNKINFLTIFEKIKDEVLSFPEALLAKNACDEILSAIKAKPNNSRVKILEEAGYEVNRLRNDPETTLVLKKNNQLFKIEFHKPSIFSISPIFRSHQNEYKPIRMEITFNSIINSLSPLQRATLSLSARHDRAFRQEFPVINSNSLPDLNFVEGWAGFLTQLMPNQRLEIQAGKNHYLKKMRNLDCNL